MKKIINWLDVNFEPILMALLFYAIVALLSVQIVLRFGFSKGLSWAEELSRYIFVWLMFFSFSYAVRNQRNIRISFFAQKFGEKVEKILYILSDFIFMGFIVVVFFAAINVCKSAIKYGDMAVTFKVSLNIVYGAGVTGFGLMIIRLVQSIVWKIKHFKSNFEVFDNYNGKYYKNNKICFFKGEDKEPESDQKIETNQEE